jgi:hypothetical protein
MVIIYKKSTIRNEWKEIIPKERFPRASWKSTWIRSYHIATHFYLNEYFRKFPKKVTNLIKHTVILPILALNRCRTVPVCTVYVFFTNKCNFI